MKLTTEDLSRIIKEELEAVLSEKDDRCTRIAKRKYDVWPSAYASGAVVQCRRGKIWKGLKEEDAHPEVDEMINEDELTDEEKAELRKILKDEGGAAGMKNFKDKIDKPEKDIKKAAEDDDQIDLIKNHFGGVLDINFCSPRANSYAFKAGLAESTKPNRPEHEIG